MDMRQERMSSCLPASIKTGTTISGVTDGTAAGTSEISVAGVGSEGLFGLPPASPQSAASPDGRVLFSGINAKGDFNLWVTNGTSAGTSEISLAKQDPNGLIPQNLTVFGNKVLFEGLDKNLNSNLWVTDGTAAGTSELSVNGQNTETFVPRKISRCWAARFCSMARTTKTSAPATMTCG